jgi:hypothetical protein
MGQGGACVVNAACPVCQLRCLHTAEDRTANHPLAGQGYQEGQGWSSEAARLAHEEDAAKLTVVLRPRANA